jgi:hypothetical protein
VILYCNTPISLPSSECLLILEGQEPDVAVSFLHSPLLYWNCSATAIESDSSVLTTINSGAHQISPANITLRPSSVLAAMRLSHNRLAAADALVVSLFYKDESTAGDLWDEQAKSLAQHDQSRWEVYRTDSRGAGSRFFNFQSRPISVQDEAIFFCSYGLVLLYIVSSLRNVRTLKSRVGLFMTIAIQVSIPQRIQDATETTKEGHHNEFSTLQECFSIFSSFTLARFLRIDVSNVPPEAYPFIVLVVGLENMSESASSLLEAMSNLLKGFGSSRKWKKRRLKTNQSPGWLQRSEPSAISH